MPMETLLTIVVALGVPLWLVAEELIHRFADRRSRPKVVEPRVVRGATTADTRRPLQTSSHVA